MLGGQGRGNRYIAIRPISRNTLIIGIRICMDKSADASTLQRKRHRSSNRDDLGTLRIENRRFARHLGNGRIRRQTFLASSGNFNER